MLRVIPPLPPLGRGGHRRSAVWQPWVSIPLWPSQECGLGRSFCLSEAEVFILSHCIIVPCWKRWGGGGGGGLILYEKTHIKRLHGI